MANFRVYAIGGIKYLDLEHDASEDVENLYRIAIRAGYVVGSVREEDYTRKVLIPARGIGIIVEMGD